MAHLLIVEDDRKTNEAICEYMISAGHRAIPAYDGAEALQAGQFGALSRLRGGRNRRAGTEHQ